MPHTSQPRDTERRFADHRPIVGAESYDETDSVAFVRAWENDVGGTAGAGAPSRPWRFVREVMQTAALAVLIFFATQSVVQGREILGPSMQPNYHQGERLFINRALYTRLDQGKWSRLLPFLSSGTSAKYVFHAPRRGEVVVFDPPFKSSDDLIKRVVGVPGDHIVVKDGAVSVNGSPIEERYLPGTRTSCAGRWCDITLGPDQYYVMGDNRPNSSDSRMWGPVSGGSIIGKAWLVSFPLSEFGRAP